MSVKTDNSKLTRMCVRCKETPLKKFSSRCLWCPKCKGLYKKREGKWVRQKYGF